MKTTADPASKKRGPKQSRRVIDAFLSELPMRSQHTVLGWAQMIATPKGDAILMLDPFDGYVILTRLVAVDRGAGRAAMEMVVAAADEYQITLNLTACPIEPVGGGKLLTNRALENFYAGFGFQKYGYRDNGGHIKMSRIPR